MIVGYARTSTFEQKYGLEAQHETLTDAGCDRVFSEQASSASKRRKLDEVLDFVREDDVLVVTRIDRLARSIIHLWQIVEKLEAKNVALRILNLALDTQSATGKLMLSVLGAVAEFESAIMLERPREGIEKAKAAGVRFGRPPLKRTIVQQVRELRSKGVGATDIANQLQISRASVYRVLQSASPRF
jgi:DNA invertase Pin-like site-specific DNA recombinase